MAEPTKRIRQITDKEARVLAKRWMAAPTEMPKDDAMAFLAWVAMRNAKRGTEN